MAALYAWLQRHPKLVDGALAVLLACVSLIPILVGGRYRVAPLVLGVTVPVVFRRTHPTGSFVAGIVAGGIYVVAKVAPSPSGLAIVVLLYTLAAYRPRRISVTGLAVCLIGAVTEMARLRALDSLNVLDWLLAGSAIFGAPCLVAWVLGDSMRYRRAYYANLEERAARLEAERDAQAQIAAAAERARIARELHDVVAHNVSVMVVQADGASYALDRDPDRARQAMAAVAGTGRQALAEMRRLLGVLRTDAGAGEPGRAPLPGIGQLGELLDQARAAGLPVSLTVEGVPRPLPGGLALAAYRIIQESLTNTRKHGGPQAEARVTLRYLEDALVLRVTDDGRGAAALSDGAGHGLTGMRERVAVYAGSVHAEPQPGGGFAVTARLPLVPGAAGPSGPSGSASPAATLSRASEITQASPLMNGAGAA